MLNPEDFRHQLEKIEQGIVEQRKLAKNALKKEEETAQLNQQRERERAREQKRVAIAEEAKKNQVVLELESRLPIKQYLGALRDQTARGRKIKTWGPEGGQIVHGFIYREKTETRNNGYREVYRPAHDGNPHGGRFDKVAITKNVGVCFLLGAIIDCSKRLEIVTMSKEKELFGWLPIKLQDWHNSIHIAHIGSIDSIEGGQQFTQALTDFYVEVKTGQIK